MTHGQTKRTKREMRRYEAFGWILAAFFTAAFGALLISTTLACVVLSSLTTIGSAYGLFEVAKVLRVIDQELCDAESASRQFLPPRGGTDKA